MRNTVKKIASLFMVIALMLSIAVINVSAVTGTVSVGFSDADGKVKLGETVTVYISYKNITEEATASGTVTFDSSKLQYVSSSPKGDTTNVGNNVFLVADDMAKEHFFRIDFKTIAEGQTTIKASDCLVATNEEFKLNNASATLTIGATQTNPTPSGELNSTKKAAITSLKVSGGTLSPAFSSEITEYTVVVPYTHTDGVISCDTLDPKATVNVEGDRELKVGLNKRTLVVRATDGTIRRYTVTFNRLDENGNDTTAGTGNEDKLKLFVGSKEYYVSEDNAAIQIPLGFSLTVAKYGDKDIAAYSDQTGKNIIAYLVATDDSDEDFFILKDGNFYEFNYIESKGVTYIINDLSTAVPNGYYKSDYSTGNKILPCYKYNDSKYSDFVIFSADTLDGNTGYYRYDTKEGTMQRYLDIGSIPASSSVAKEIKVTPVVRTTVLIAIILFVLILIAVIVLVIVAAVNKGKKERLYTEETEEIFDTEYAIDVSSDTPEE